MNRHTFSTLAHQASGKILRLAKDQEIHTLLLDSRKITQPATALFFAIKGQRHDGHKYLSDLYKQGVRAFVVETDEAYTSFPEANIVQVPSAIEALQKIAAFHRQQFTLPLIAITGSNGKTIVKEWLAQMLSADRAVVKNPKSFNSQVGVPLSVWEINAQHQIGIFEAGISLPDEMQRLQNILQPSLGIFTNLGTAHSEGFESDEQKAREKLKLFAQVEKLILREENSLVFALAQSMGIPLLPWSTNNKNSPFYVEVISTAPTESHICIHTQGLSIPFTLPFGDEASIENLLHGIRLLFHLGINPQDIQQRLSQLQPLAMRLELKEGINRCYLIDDSYNNDLAGLKLALNHLQQQSIREKKTLILSDIPESGQKPEELYPEVAALLKQQGVTRLIGIGTTLSRFASLFPVGSVFFPTTQAFLEQQNFQLLQNELILVKGARVFQFEKIVHRLIQKHHGTVFEINLDALVHNLNFYRSRLQPGTKIMLMVKAFAYGSGSYEVASLLQYHRADYLAVAYADEGAELREKGIRLPIMVMNPSPSTFDKILAYQLEPELYSFKVFQEFLAYLKDKNASCKIHIKLDTGMKRLGFEAHELPALISALSAQQNMQVASAFSHLAAADESTHHAFTLAQIQRFDSLSLQLQQALGYEIIRHIANSAGILSFPQAHFNMVRLGIGLYGVEANALEQKELQNVGTLKTIISQIKKVSKEESVGYGRKGVLHRDSTIATIAIGYADGYRRHFSNGVGRVWVNGKLCPIVGNVCMDMCMVDITEAQAKEGDEVILFGREYPIQEAAKAIHTIPYELLTGINERVKRVFYTE